jgi:hypothetical protein
MPRYSDDNSPFHFTLALLSILPLAAWKGFVLTRLWTWFVVPLGMPGLSVWHAAGLGVLVGWLTDSAAIISALTSDEQDGQTSDEQDGQTSDEQDGQTSGGKLGHIIVIGLVGPLFAWVLGAVYHALM